MKRALAIGPTSTTSTCCRWSLMALAMVPLLVCAQGGDKQLQVKADALFASGSYAKALPMYSQLVSLEPGDHDLNYRLGTCTLYGGDDKEKAIGYLKFAVQGPATNNLAWYFLGRAYHLDYHFDEAIAAYSHFRGTADRKLLDKYPVDVLVQQCRNGKNLLGNIKDIKVFNKVEVAASDFFRFYDLSDIGGKIVTTPDELMTSLDKKSKERSLVYLPTGGGTIYFSSYGKDGKTGRDIYRTEVLPTGGFSDPVKLAGYVNTDQDEDYAAMAPDGKTFYFCSKGHNSMGGYDVFKSSYDKASGIFGPPENMDFAVNTPADELLYIVGPDGKQACFASTRESQQDMETVYRVGTTPSPVNLTVIKGTYASAFDITDRKAHIIIEDALTREKVADVKTDINGGYLIAVPRGGRYSLLVEGGPNGKTHLGEMEVPSSDQPSAYAQEIKLVNEGGEKLAITSHFDQPLQEDVMALAFDEIKRRAKLEVTEEKPVDVAFKGEKAKEDPMNAAGFAGNMTVDDALKLAQDQQGDLAQRAVRQGKEADAAFALAASNVDVAEQASALAQRLVETAEPMAQGSDRDSLMTQAAEARQRAKEASDRASAAFDAGHDLGAAQQKALDQATQAAKISASLAHAMDAKDTVATTDALKQLNAQADEQSGPKAALSEDERARRAASDAEKVAAGKLAEANAQREDEVALADRIARMKRDRDNAKGKKKEDLTTQVAALESQHAALVQETDVAFTKAQKTEEDAARARGQVALLRHIQADSASSTAPTAVPDLSGMKQRVQKVNASIAALSIDQRYDASITESAKEKERRTFDWNTSSNDLAQTDNAKSTEARTAMVPTTSSTRAASSKSTTSTAADRSGVKQTTSSATAAAPSGKDHASTTSQAPGSGIVETAMDLGTGAAQPRQAAGTSTRQHDGSAPAALLTSSVSDPSKDAGSTNDPKQTVGTTGDVAAAENEDAPDTAEEERSASIAAAVNDEEEQMFFASNKLAELKQLRQGASKKAERDSLDQEIKSQEQLMTALHRSRLDLDAQANAQPAKDADQAVQPDENADSSQVDVADTGDTVHPGRMKASGSLQYTLLDNDPASLSEQSVDDIIPGFTMRKKQIAEAAGNEKGKAIAQHQLEAALVDSIDAHIARQTKLLAQHPDEAATIQHKIDHLQELRSEHVKAADEALAVAQKQEPSKGATPSASASIANGNGPVKPGSTSQADHSAVTQDALGIYESALPFRSPKAQDAAAVNSAELKLAKADQAKIDSLQAVLAAMPEGGARKDVQKQMDEVKNDLLTRVSGIGQRAGFIMKEEYAAAQDSAAALDNVVTKLGRPANDPLSGMATGFAQAAQVAMDDGALMRKNAVRTSNITARDSLNRVAYADELQALQKLDQAITVRNYVLQARPAAGENITYAEVEQRMAQGPAADVSAAQPAAAKADQTPVAGNASATSNAATAVVPAPSKEVLKNDPVSDAQPDPVTASDGKAAGGAAITSVVAEPVTAAVPGGKSDGPAKGAVQLAGASLPEESSVAQQKPANTDTLAHAQAAQQDEGQGRYFYLRARARAVRQDADAALADASARTDKAWELKNKAAGMSASGGNAAEAKRTAAQSVALFAQADSLRAVAQEMARIASGLDGQAAVYLTTIPKQQAGALVAMDTALPNSAPVAKTPAPTPAPAAKDEVAVVAPAPEKAAPIVQQAPADTVPSMVAAVEPVKPKPAPIAVPKPIPVPAPAPKPAPVPAPAPVSPLPSTATAFAVGPDVAPRQGPIPMDVAMPKHLIYMVQVGVFRNELPVKAFQDMTPVTGMHVGNGVVRYSAGRFDDRQEALKAQDQIRARGYKDAFVVAYKDGQRITLNEADAEEGGSVAAATPATSTTDVSTPAPASTPVATPAASTTNAEDKALAQYPTSAQAVLADFHPMPAAENYYNDPTAAPAKQVETVKGLFFTVQVGVYSKPTALDRLFNITPLNSERTANGKIRYTTGMYRDVAAASTRKNATVVLGVPDAFVTAYLNGKRIPLNDARALLAKLGPSILVDPQLATP